MYVCIIVTVHPVPSFGRMNNVECQRYRNLILFHTRPVNVVTAVQGWQESQEQIGLDACSLYAFMGQISSCIHAGNCAAPSNSGNCRLVPTQKQAGKTLELDHSGFGRYSVRFRLPSPNASCVDRYLTSTAMIAKVIKCIASMKDPGQPHRSEWTVYLSPD